MNQHSIILIGGGNMGGAIALRWQAAQPGSVHVVESNPERRTALHEAGITTHAALEDAPLADAYLLAIKPQQFAENAAALKHRMSEREPLLISIMAGVPLSELQAITPNAVRVMPNLPALIGESMSVLCAPALAANQRQQLTDLFAHIGAVAWVEDEAQLHAVTAISGSGPGYVFAFMEALQAASVAHGLSPELSRLLVAQTLRGSALLAAESEETFATLRAQVSSKGGTTEAALKSFAHHDLNGMVNQGVEAAAKRSAELAKK